ncbi:MAG TPA: MFS transporter [Myxococcales bacterium]|nr:MFS transporter [Myxococcales bacterium]
MSDAPQAKTLGGVLRQRAFRTIWVAQFVSIFGDFLALFAVISLITFRLHGTASDVALVCVAYMAPVAFVAPVGGVLVDRWPVRRVMIASDLIRAILAASLLLARTVPQIGLALAAIGFVSSFFGPAQSVAVRTVVATEDLLAANAMLSQAFYVVRIFSPAVAGALVAWLGENSCFWLDTGSFLFSAAMISTLSIVRPVSGRRDGSLRALGRDFLEGNGFIFTHRELSFAFLASAFAMFMLSSFSPLISVYIRDTLGAGALLYGAITAMVGVGLIVGTQTVRSAAKDRAMHVLVLAGLFLLALGAALLGAFRFRTTAALSTFTIGFAIAFVVVPAQTLSQRDTPPAMQGRVSSTFMALFSLAQVLGMLISGVLADHLGIRQLFISCAATVAVLASAGYFLLRPRAQTRAAA